VIIQHYGWDDFSKLWWTIPDRDSLAALLKPYRVAAIFHGHSHAVEHRTWMGIPIWSAGSTVKEGQPGDILYARFRKGQIRVWHL
jgi:predicted phosphodiesterase